MKKKILLIDDSNEFRSLIAIYLSEKYEIAAAENGAMALEKLQNGFIPDIIVSDLMMPEMNGAEMLDQVKISGMFNRIPVIFLSSIDKSSQRIELFKSGAFDYLIKPVNPEELEARIENALRTVENY